MLSLLQVLPSSIRLAALIYTVTSTPSNKPFSQIELQRLRQSLPAFFTETDAKYRTDFTGIFKRLYQRIDSAMAYLGREIKKSATNEIFKLDVLQETRLQHEGFVDWLIGFLWTELVPSASYQRHYVAIKALLLMMQHGNPNVTRKLIDQTGLRLLTDLLMDRFDDVRSGAANLLKISISSKLWDVTVESLSHIKITEESISEARSEDCDCGLMLCRATSIMTKSGRADHADGLARIYDIIATCEGSEAVIFVVQDIIERLSRRLALMKQSLASAASRGPVQAYFTALRYIFDRSDFYSKTARGESIRAWGLIHEQIVKICVKTWGLVENVLCNDSPEGNILLGQEADDDVGTKDVLSFSWRAVRESSLLLRTLLSKAPLNDDDSGMINHSIFEEIGEVTFLQLGNLRHRGAFTTVSQTFVVFCEKCSLLQGNLPIKPLNHWYLQALDCVESKATRITRRSGGIPSMMVGILSAIPGQEEFDVVIKQLQAKAREPVKTAAFKDIMLPQVHALNCLKDVFKTPKLDGFSEPWIGSSLRLAAGCLNSQVLVIDNLNRVANKILDGHYVIVV
jgi:hypothetical protein